MIALFLCQTFAATLVQKPYALLKALVTDPLNKFIELYPHALYGAGTMASIYPSNSLPQKREIRRPEQEQNGL